MIVRLGSGWQTLMADLSMILFMITASTLAQAPDDPRPAPPPPPTAPSAAPLSASPRGEPVALWRDGPGAPPLATWLAQQPADPRARLTVLVRYAGEAREQAMRDAARLAAEAGTRGRTARIMVEPGAVAGATVTLAYDSERLR